MKAEPEPDGDVAARVTSVTTVGELAGLLRELRRREARERRGRVLTYQELVERTGWAIGSIAAYLNGLTLPPTERFDVLTRHLGARPQEYGPLATARDRVDDAQRPQRVGGGHGAAAPSGWSEATPRALPAVPRSFTGRTLALAQLDAILAETAAAGAVVVTAVAGMGGVGKTTLAVHWGHSTVEHFGGGQLYVNLRGYDPSEPLSTLDALGTLLTGLGAPPSVIPPDEAGRLSLYQDQLRGRRMMVLLDNARSSAHVQPLLPPPPCLALITSRDELSGLTADGDVRRVRLDVFAEDEAVALVRRLVGVRADREPEAVRALARKCGYLPLALRVVAEIAVSRPEITLSTLVNELETDFDETGLDTLDTGDLRSDLRAVMDWSVRVSSAPAAHALRLLGLMPGRDIDEYGLAALAGITPAQAADLLATLRRAHLVVPWPPGRYSTARILFAVRLLQIVTGVIVDFVVARRVGSGQDLPRLEVDARPLEIVVVVHVDARLDFT